MSNRKLYGVYLTGPVKWEPVGVHLTGPVKWEPPGGGHLTGHVKWEPVGGPFDSPCQMEAGWNGII